MDFKDCKRFILLIFIVTISIYSQGQDCSNTGGDTWNYYSADEITGSYTQSMVWCNSKPPANGEVDRLLNIYGTITRNGDFNPVTTNVYDTLYVYGKYTNNKWQGLTVHGSAHVEIFGDFEAKQSLNVSANGTLIIHGNALIENAGADISGNMIVLGDINIKNSSITNTGNLIAGNNFTFPGGGFNSPSGNSNIYILNPSANITTANYGPINNGDYGSYQDLLNYESSDLIALVNHLYGSTLPVELVSFSAKLNNKAVELNWSTASELNNDFFCIERSIDAQNFSEIARVTGNGTSHTTVHYNYTDQFPKSGISYYRLKQVDFDGTTDYSDIISINKRMAYMESLAPKVYPNPYSSDALIIKIPFLNGNNTINVEIKELNGLLVYAETFEKTNGELVIQNTSLSNLGSGLYVINLTLGSEQFTQKLQVL